MVCGWLREWKWAVALGLTVIGGGAVLAGGSNPNELPWGAPNAKNPSFNGDHDSLALLKIQVAPSATATMIKPSGHAWVRLPDPEVVLIDELMEGDDPTKLDVAAVVTVEGDHTIEFERNPAGIDLGGTFLLDGDTPMELVTKGPGVFAFLNIGPAGPDGKITSVDAMIPVEVKAGKIQLGVLVQQMQDRGYIAKAARLAVTQVTPQTEGGSLPETLAVVDFELSPGAVISVETETE